MTMAIDPRTMKTILQMQWSQRIGLQGQTSTASTVDSLFDTLLQQLTEEQPEVLGDSAYRPATLEGYLAAPPDRYVGAMTGLLPASAALAETWQTGGADAGAGSVAPYETLIQEAAARHGVDPSLVKAVIQTESGFRPDAESSAGAKGLMQLMDGTARGLGVTDSFDPRQNIDGGTKYLAHLLRKYDGQLSVALAAYNAGPGRVDRLGIGSDAELTAKRNTLPNETQRYVEKVADALRQYK
ncbi:hypothetical protein PA598K_03856 [Paenibacillus sp. 598K]|uniref:lytic transglycosylase domain-containing protein n=1 Tax=Paenibacillus sp. 598K TaxID=1117987 RepID=UPI000FFA8B56|nr:lytic transglycosylase domain-containing protein [Paenibacillus sp. 598K]GBF75444.1 hypothetical protein PA598K_03856 [Paenibacillus sp. 598K]